MGLDPEYPHPLVTVLCSQITLITGKLLEEKKMWIRKFMSLFIPLFYSSNSATISSDAQGTWL